MAKIYLVDSENIGSSWSQLLSSMSDEDKMYVFYTDKSPYISYENLLQVIAHCHIPVFIKCFEGKNALDFQLVSELGFKLCQDPDQEFVIVSDDYGYDAAVRYWSGKKYNVRRIGKKYCRPLQPRRNEDAPAVQTEVVAVHVQDEQPVQSEQPIREEQPVQSEQHTQEEQLVQSEQPIREEQPVQSKQPTQNERHVQSEQPIREEQPAQSEQTAQNEQLVKSENSMQEEQFVQNEQPMQEEQSVQSEQPTQNEQPVQSEYSMQEEQSVPSEQTTREEQSAQNEQTIREMQPTQNEQPAQKEQPVQSRKSTREEQFKKNEQSARKKQPAKNVKSAQKTAAQTNDASAAVQEEQELQVAQQSELTADQQEIIEEQGTESTEQKTDSESAQNPEVIQEQPQKRSKDRRRKRRKETVKESENAEEMSDKSEGDHNQEADQALVQPEEVKKVDDGLEQQILAMVTKCSSPEPEKDAHCVRELFHSLTMSDLTTVNTAMKILIGNELGNDIYRELKEHQECRAQLDALYYPAMKDRFIHYVQIVLDRSELQGVTAEEAGDFLIRIPRKNLNSIRSAMLKEYGHELGSGIYTTFKPHIKVLNKI